MWKRLLRQFWMLLLQLYVLQLVAVLGFGLVRALGYEQHLISSAVDFVKGC